MQQLQIIENNARTSRDLGLPKLNPFPAGTDESLAFERGWTAVDGENNWIAELPDLSHPFAEYTLKDAVRLAISHSQLISQPAPSSLEDVRKVIQQMWETANHLWTTGMAALDVLDAACDGRNLKHSCRLC